jgi:hypothetical protein
MMRHFLPILLLFGSLGAAGQGVKGQGVTVFKADTTINGALILMHPKSIVKTIGDQMKWVIEGSGAPRVLLTNTGRTEYLILYHGYGGWHNEFDEFEVGLMKGMKGKFRTFKVDSFVTESGVRLGMTVEELVAVKGKKFVKAREEGKEVLRYTLDNFPKGILGRYNMPEYEASYFFDGGRLVKFVFGFPNP